MHNLDILYGKYDYARNVQKRKETVAEDLLFKPGYYWQELRKDNSKYLHFSIIESWSTFHIYYSWYMLTCLKSYDLSSLKTGYLKLRKSILKMKHMEYKS